MIENKKVISEIEREVVLWRLKMASPDLCLSIGNSSAVYSRDDLLNLIRNGDAVGDDYVRMQWEFIRKTKDASSLINTAEAG